MIIEGDGDNTIVAFSSLGADGKEHIDGKSRLEFMKSLSEIEAKKIFVTDKRKFWYCHGISGMGTTTHDSMTVLRRLIKGRALFLGHSAGGFGAILYGSNLADRVLAFSPQTTVTDSVDDNRWRKYTRKIPCPLDLKNAVPWGNVPIDIIICNVDESQHLAFDKLHARHVQNFPNVNIIDGKCNTHNSAKHWIQSGGMLRYIRKWL